MKAASTSSTDLGDRYVRLTGTRRMSERARFGVRHRRAHASLKNTNRTLRCAELGQLAGCEPPVNHVKMRA